jgi:hypothetical protein
MAGDPAPPIAEPGTPEQMAALKKLSRLSHMPQSTLTRLGLDLVIKKYGKKHPI